MSMADEKAFVEAIRTAVDPVPVWWGYAPEETAEEPPTLPMIAVQRLNAAPALSDLCIDTVADVTLQVHVWHEEYEAARVLMSQVRAALLALEIQGEAVSTWQERQEYDQRDGALHAWMIAAEWAGEALDMD